MNFDREKADFIANLLLLVPLLGIMVSMLGFGVSNAHPIVVIVSALSFFCGPIALLVGLVIKVFCWVKR